MFEITQSKESRYQHPPGYKIFGSKLKKYYYWSLDGLRSHIFSSYSHVYHDSWNHYMNGVEPSFCKCGCGAKTRQMQKVRGKYKKGDYREFINGHDTRILSPKEQQRRGRRNDGSTLRGTGEGKSYTKFHGKHLHRIIAEQKIGRTLLPGEIVHHKDINKKNNHPNNLEILPSQGDHCRRHFLGRKGNEKSGGSP